MYVEDVVSDRCLIDYVNLWAEIIHIYIHLRQHNVTRAYVLQSAIYHIIAAACFKRSMAPWEERLWTSFDFN